MGLTEFRHTAFHSCLMYCHRHVLCVFKRATHCSEPSIAFCLKSLTGHLPSYKSSLETVEIGSLRLCSYFVYQLYFEDCLLELEICRICPLLTNSSATTLVQATIALAWVIAVVS